MSESSLLALHRAWILILSSGNQFSYHAKKDSSLSVMTNHLVFLFVGYLVIWAAWDFCILSFRGNRRIPLLHAAVCLCQQARSGLGITVLPCTLLLKEWWLLTLRSPGRLTTLGNDSPPVFFRVCWPFQNREKSLVQQNWASSVWSSRFDWNICFGSYGISGNLMW